TSGFTPRRDRGMAVINRGMSVKKKVSGLHRSLYCSVHCYSLDKNYYVRIYTNQHLDHFQFS
ncbi:hypothetical protein WDU94_001351, partial [Cyamophila willieti]